MLAATPAVKFDRVPHPATGANAVKVVLENSDHDLVRQRAKTQVEWALREMTANLLRVVRGAGKSYQIGQQAQTLLQALVDYREAVGTFPPADELSGILSVEQDPEMLAHYGEREARRAYAQQRVIRGALQVTASRLLGQLTQKRVGEHEMYNAIFEMEAIRDEARREIAASTARTKRRDPPTRRRKPKA